MDAELERRYANVRAAMAAHGLDALVVSGSEYTGFEGAVTYLTGFQIVHRYAYVVVPGEGRVTSYDGNAPYSGAHAQLDNTELDPGEVLRAPLSFDVRSPHGRLQFVPDSSPAIVWRF